MLLHILIRQRHEAYPGQYGLESVVAMDEYGLDGNAE